jgi:outer membrane protein TolC
VVDIEAVAGKTVEYRKRLIFARAWRGAGVALALLALLGGCATVRNARSVQDPASRVPGERTPTAAELGLPVKGPVSLDEVVRAAVGAHPAVVQARRAAEAAETRVRQAEGAALPQASASAAAGYQAQQGSPPGSPDRFVSFGFDVSWTILDFGLTSALARQAGEQWIAAQLDERFAEVQAAFNARNAYFELAKQVQLHDVALEAVRQFEVHLDQVRELERVGYRAPYDVTKAEVDLGTAKLAEVQTRDAVLAAEAALASAVGLAEVVEWTADADAVPPPVPEGFDEAWSVAQGGQPALAAAAARERAVSSLVDARIAALYPELSLGLGVTWSGTPTPVPWSLKLGPAVRWTPFDGFQNLASIDEAVATLRGARAALAQVAQQAWLDVRSAWLLREDARQRLALTALTVRSAEENQKLAQGRFEVGIGTSVDLTDAEQSLISARAAQIEAATDAAIAASRLARTLGVAVPGQKKAP